jgi:hypothetical protein
MIDRKIVQRALRAVERDDEYLGFCVKCGNGADGIEPDAHGYRCESCGQMAVWGAEEIVLMSY